jgi:hypothetical protein
MKNAFSFEPYFPATLILVFKIITLRWSPPFIASMPFLFLLPYVSNRLSTSWNSGVFIGSPSHRYYKQHPTENS